MSSALASAMARLAGLELGPAIALRLVAVGRAWDTASVDAPASVRH
jgi:hypothetical protein